MEGKFRGAECNGDKKLERIGRNGRVWKEREITRMGKCEGL